ncbi:hypothetical protein TSUD_278740 [Trifolium subterraneum]|uniref:Uncharacterized protein n=1 Tax=Trifolium subterraneum TaxID=3900 RepID=A0A2Z6N574_TRISU|nr:hypothetical protein TSUD_278740 [Trifolium subterraneum]
MVDSSTSITRNDGDRRLWRIERGGIQAGGAIKGWRSSFHRGLVLERGSQRPLLRLILIFRTNSKGTQNKIGGIIDPGLGREGLGTSEGLGLGWGIS